MTLGQPVHLPHLFRFFPTHFTYTCMTLKTVHIIQNISPIFVTFIEAVVLVLAAAASVVVVVVVVVVVIVVLVVVQLSASPVFKF